MIYDVVCTSIHTTCGMNAHLYHIVGLSALYVGTPELCCACSGAAASAASSMENALAAAAAGTSACMRCVLDGGASPARSLAQDPQCCRQDNVAAPGSFDLIVRRTFSGLDAIN